MSQSASSPSVFQINADPPRAALQTSTPEPVVKTCCLSVQYQNKQAVKDVELEIQPGRVTAIIGPSGCGKSSFLASLNRMTDLIPGCTVTGSARIAGHDVHEKSCNVLALRRDVGMIFQKPSPFATSVLKNLTMPMKEHGVKSKALRQERAETLLQEVGLWHEVKDRLHTSALSLSGGQQQRLCIARALALRPKLLLMDEPCSALDPMASGVIEDLILSLREGCCATDDRRQPLTLVVVTHNLAQARRISDDTAMFWCRDGCGVMIETGSTPQIFTEPKGLETAQYIQGIRG